MSDEAKEFLNSYGNFVTKVTSEPSLDQGSLDARMKEIDSSSPICLLYTSPSPRDATLSRMPSSA